MVTIVYILLMGHITHVNLVPVRRVMMGIMVIQLGAQLKKMIAPSVQFQSIKRQLVVRAISRAQQDCRRASPQRVTTVQFLDARFHS